MPLVPTIIRCCAHIVRLVCGQTDRWTDVYRNPPAHAPRVNNTLEREFELEHRYISMVRETLQCICMDLLWNRYEDE